MADHPDDLFKKYKAVIDAVVKAVCREFGFREDAEDFRQDVYVHVLEKDAAVLRDFEGRSKLSTYLYVIVKRKALDLRRRQWRRWRPSKPARDYGRAGVLLEMLMMRDGYPLEQALEMVLRRFPTENPDALKALAAGFRASLKPRPVSDDELEDRPSRDLNPADLFDETDREFRRERVARRIAKLIKQRPALDRLVFRLRFRKGESVANIARTLKMDQKALYRRLDEIVKWLRKILKDEGLL